MLSLERNRVGESGRTRARERESERERERDGQTDGRTRMLSSYSWFKDVINSAAQRSWQLSAFAVKHAKVPYLFFDALHTVAGQRDWTVWDDLFSACYSFIAPVIPLLITIKQYMQPTTKTRQLFR